MNRVKRQESGNELQSSQRLGLQSASCKLLNTATVPVPAAEVQLKKSIGGILKNAFVRALLPKFDTDVSVQKVQDKAQKEKGKQSEKGDKGSSSNKVDKGESRIPHLPPVHRNDEPD